MGTFLVAGHSWPVLAMLLLISILAGQAGAEDPAATAVASVAETPSPGVRRFDLTRLLSWPQKEDNGEDDDEEDVEPPLESDRPDFTESSATVGYGRFQVESGYTYTHDRLGSITRETHDLPELLLRYGVAERLELRLAWEGWIFDHQSDGANRRVVGENGSTDLECGLKYALTKQDKWLPQSALILAITAPIGSPAFSSQQVDAEVNFCYSWEFTKRLSLNCSTGHRWTGQPGDHFSLLFQSASVEYELTKRLHVYSEWFALFPGDSLDDRPQHFYDGGCTYLLTPNVQLDWRAGLGLNDAAGGFFTGCGLVIRW